MDKYDSIKWYNNEILYQENEPVVIIKNGSIKWYYNGKLYRLDGLAVIRQ